YVIPSPNDSRGGIIETLRQMTEIMSRGGGVGINISSLRPRHSYVKGVNGRSSGAISWGALYSFVTGLIEQGGSRRGALMLILNDWHPDVFDFINSKRAAGQITNANISVGVSDKLMDAVKADGDWDLVFPDTSYEDYDQVWDGDLEAWEASGRRVIHYRTVKARDLWNTIIESAWASAEPGLWFRERYNKMSNSWYHAPIVCTNPCVTGDTRVYTSKGMIRAAELFEDETDIDVVIDGRFDSTPTAKSSRVFFTGVKPVYRLQTREGYSLRATANHRIMTPEGWVELGDLKPGDRLHILNRKGGFGVEGSLELGRVLGWLVGDGTVKRDSAVLSFFGEEKRELAPVFAGYVNDLVAPLTHSNRSYEVGVGDVADRDEARVSSTRLHRIAQEYGLAAKKHQVPEVVFQGQEAMQRGFLQALFTADGSFQDGGEKGGSVRLAANTLDLLEDVQRLLSNFGIASRIYRNRRAAGYRQTPDSARNLKPYWCEAQHELVISKANMVVFADEIGFLMGYKQDALNDYVARGKRGPYQEYFTATVEAVVEDGVEAVYDLTEPLTHSFVANGMVVHNCGEQGLPAFGVCNLGAINLAKFYDDEAHDVDWDALEITARYATRFLDNVIDTTPYFFDENRDQQLGERRVGLNNMGLAELMIKLGVRYGSDESVAFIDKLYGFLARVIYETSIELAQEKGSFPAFEAEKFVQSGFMQSMPADIREKVLEHGIRNVTLTTQAPTGTTGTMVNTSTGIEPFFSWIYYRKSRLGLHEEQVPLVKEWYEQNPDETELPDYFVTAMDLSPEEHVKVQAAIQRWVDSSISKTCNVPNSYTMEQVSDLYMYMYDLGCKGGTIYRDGSRDEQVLMLKGDERAESEVKSKQAEPEVVEQVSTPHKVYPRPKTLSGVTISRKTPFGTAYITMNSDEQGCPFEVFVTVGKAGSDLQADAEGLGRMLSLQLRTTAPQNRMQMLRLIIEQLQGIGGARSVGMGPQRVSSLPDVVAAALVEHYFPPADVQQLDLLPKETEAPAPPPVQQSNGHHTGFKSGADMCPECGTISLIRIEGCRKCEACGYSEC
ncbi:MAG: ribonucleoside-diphosphate reductase, partial [Anaerolineae bacterium]|nr:ribonucleoside-diphosphate reductase [Anaerolineae bacterium]